MIIFDRFSLSTSISKVVTLTAFVAFTLFIILVSTVYDGILEHQVREIKALSASNLSQRLSTDASLAAARITNMIFAIRTHDLVSTAQRSDVRNAVETRNVAAISEILNPAVTASDLDGILVVDEQFHIIGGHSNRLDILPLSKLVNSGVFPASFSNYLSTATKNRIVAAEALMQVDPRLFMLPDIKGSSGPVNFVQYPIFDDFGDVQGALIGYRAIRLNEHVLSDFVDTTNTKIIIRDHGKSIYSFGLGENATISGPSNDGDLLEASSDLGVQGDFRAKCVAYSTGFDVCGLASVADLNALTSKLSHIGNQDSGSLVYYMIIFGIVSLASFALVSHFVARQITAPLVTMTKVVSHIADGRVDVDVPSTGRKDEIGNIARAVQTLRSFVMERDALKENTAAQNRVLVEKETQLNLQNSRFDSALANMPQGLCMLDADGGVIVANQRFCELKESDPRLATPGKPYASGDETDTTPQHDKRRRIELTDAFRSEFQMSDGRFIAISHQPTPEGGWVGIYDDVTLRKKSEERINYLASHDPLTGLWNRHIFLRNLEESYLYLPNIGEGFGVLAMDLDGFKAVNDTFGHPFGDQLIKMVAVRLKKCVRQNDTVSRLGGDEFAILLRGVREQSDMQKIARNIIAQIAQPFIIEGKRIAVSMSVGIALGPQDGADSDILLKNVDLALYKAKHTGKNRFCSYEASMQSDMQEKQALAFDLRQALGNGELRPVFQPIVDLGTNRTIGFEGLMRWAHPVRGNVPPTVFIPIAEETGLIDLMGEWMLRECCRTAVSWPRPLSIAVNVSPQQFSGGGIVQLVMSTLASTGLPSRLLEIEITESVVLEESEGNSSTLNMLRDMGVRISMDDFGTGYSSLRTLHNFPFDKIKIDRSFIQTISMSGGAGPIVKAAVQLATDLNILVTAEGVETAEQLEILRSIKCSQVQGYFLGKPMERSQVLTYLADEEGRSEVFMPIRAVA